jgi:hypothetical protein
MVAVVGAELSWDHSPLFQLLNFPLALLLPYPKALLLPNRVCVCVSSSSLHAIRS